MTTEDEVPWAVAARIREIHQLLKRGEDTKDHGVIGNLDCIYDSLTTVPNILDDPTPPTDALAPQSGKKEDGWIDVKERLPEKRDEYYLVAGRLSTGRYEVSYKHFSLNGYFDGTIPNHSHVAYWMPLPSPPSKAEGE